jgi:methionine--tRNA ligase beta chain
MTGIAKVDFSEWTKLDLRVAEILNVENIEGADKLYKISLDVGPEIGKRTVCAGLKEYYSKKNLIGKKIVLFANLKSRKMRGVESQGMLLAASGEDNKKLVLITPEQNAKNGWKIS